MNLHEYQGKSILKSFGVAIQEGKVVDKLENAIAAAKELSIKVPLIVRLEGTNVDLGKDILSKSDLAIISADNLEDAAQKAIASLQ